MDHNCARRGSAGLSDASRAEQVAGAARRGRRACRPRMIPQSTASPAVRRARRATISPNHTGTDNSMKRIALLALCLASAPAFAGERRPVLLETPVTYASDAGVVEQVNDECHIDDMLTHRVGEALRRLNRTGEGTIDANSAPGDAQVLRLQITYVMGVGGGAWTGPKAISLSADLIDGGKVVRHTKFKRWSVGGLWGAFKGTCSILDRTAVIVSKDLRRWVHSPRYEIKDENLPEQASAPEAASAAGATPSAPTTTESVDKDD